MNFKCPHCRTVIDLLDAQEENDIIAIIKAMSAFGRHFSVAWAYLELFGISPLRSRRKKLLLLSREMKNLFEGGEFSFQKRHYTISQAGIVEALNVVARKNFTDRLENHNYLKKVMIGIAEKEVQAAAKTAEARIREKEQKLMAGIRDPERDDEQLQKIRNIRESL